MITHAAPARVGILGNPSDGYGGRTLALAVPQYRATVRLRQAPEVTIVAQPDDEPSWPSLGAMTTHLDRHGYGTGPQLMAAAVRTFVAVAESLEVPLRGGFELSYDTTIPRQVGLGGSSALVVATLRCLAQHFNLDIPEPVLPSLALRAETLELGLAAGLQDRVVQTYGGLVAMDFGHEVIDTHFGVSHGTYEREDPNALPPLFLAYRTEAAEPSDTYHQHLRARFEAGDGHVRELLRELAALVVEGRAALRWRDEPHFASLVARNMNLRQSLGPIPESQLELITLAHDLGAPATFAGSGGAVVGCYEDDDHFWAVADAYNQIGAEVIGLDAGPQDARDQDRTRDEIGLTADIVDLDPRRH